MGKIDLQTFAGFRAWTLASWPREKREIGGGKGTRKYRIARRFRSQTRGGEGGAN